jgi:hypothetical protein
MPCGFPTEAFTSALSYKPHADDIFVSAYPKSGTTWTQNILYLILHRGAPLPADETMTEAVPHLEEMGAAFVEAMPAPRPIKIHLPVATAPWHPDARYLCVARNPFDCCVSFYHHTRGFVKHYDFADGTFDDFFACFVAGEVDFGDYFDHLVGWWALRDEPNVLFLTYEAMKADTEGAVRTIGRFLGAPWDAVVEDAEVRAKILEYSSLKRMKANPLQWASERPADVPFIRKGQVGDWRNHFSPEQARQLAARFDARCAGTGLEALWPDILAEARGAG